MVFSQRKFARLQISFAIMQKIMRIPSKSIGNSHKPCPAQIPVPAETGSPFPVRNALCSGAGDGIMYFASPIWNDLLL